MRPKSCILVDGSLHAVNFSDLMTARPLQRRIITATTSSCNTSNTPAPHLLPSDPLPGNSLRYHLFAGPATRSLAPYHLDPGPWQVVLHRFPLTRGSGSFVDFARTRPWRTSVFRGMPSWMALAGWLADLI